MKPYDNHVHTHYAYCTDDDMLPQDTAAIAQSRGCGISLVEHAGHLYTTNESYQSGEFIKTPAVLFEEKNNRMDGYREYIKQFAGGDVKLGLEVEVFTDGSLTLRDEHREGWDILLGAVHFMPERFGDDYAQGLLWSLDALISNGVDVIAHPFRVFSWAGLKPPRHIYKDVVQMMWKSRTAAELNFHYNSPDEEFFRMCVENGVKISLGSDAHRMFEVCDLYEHFRLLRSICGSADLQKVLYYP